METEPILLLLTLAAYPKKQIDAQLAEPVPGSSTDSLFSFGLFPLYFPLVYFSSEQTGAIPRLSDTRTDSAQHPAQRHGPAVCVQNTF